MGGVGREHSNRFWVTRSPESGMFRGGSELAGSTVSALLPRWVSCAFPVGTAAGSRVASAVLLCLSLRCWAGQVLLDSCQFSSQVSELTLSSRVRGLTQPVVVEREVLDC